MWKKRIGALLILLAGFGIAFFVYSTESRDGKQVPAWAERFSFHLGLDLSGGTHLVYLADTSAVKGSVSESMSALRDVIERRVNLFGVGEPVVQVESGGIGAAGQNRLIVDLPGVTDITKAVAMIGQTPLLEFKTENPNPPAQNITVGPDGTANIVMDQNAQYVATELTGRYLERAVLEFDPNTQEPIVSLQFNTEGAKLFEKITKENVGKSVAIFLDGAPISTPVVREAITGGKAQISGNFTPDEAKTLVGRLNAGALPVPISLISTETVGASLGEQAVADGVKAAIIGLLAIIIFLLFWYRLPGFVAIISLGVYVSLVLALFKLIPVTLTAAGIAGFIISIGMAVDANVLINERIKEELRAGKSAADAVRAGFSRAWLSIRDSNLSSMITSVILYWFGTSLIKGFALTFFIGILTSMFSAVVVSRIFLSSLGFVKSNKVTGFLFGSGFGSAQNKQVVSK